MTKSAKIPGAVRRGDWMFKRWRLTSVDTQEGISFMPAIWHKKIFEEAPAFFKFAQLCSWHLFIYLESICSVVNSSDQQFPTVANKIIRFHLQNTAVLPQFDRWDFSLHRLGKYVRQSHITKSVIIVREFTFCSTPRVKHITEEQ